MSFKKGHSGNPNGRPKGSLNKTTSEYREFLIGLISKQRDKIEEELSKLEGKEYINAIVMLSDYIIPKMKRTEVKGELTQKRIIVVHREEPLKQL